MTLNVVVYKRFSCLKRLDKKQFTWVFCMQAIHTPENGGHHI